MLNIYSKYAPNANPSNTDYPNGSGKDESVSDANDGTPLEMDWYNDMLGYSESLLGEGRLSPSGNPDTALVSDRLDGFRLAALRVQTACDYTGGDLSLVDVIHVGLDVETVNYVIDRNSLTRWSTGSATGTVTADDLNTSTGVLSGVSGVLISTSSAIDSSYADKKFWPTIANNVTDEDYDIDFNAGKILSADGLTGIQLTSDLTKKLDESWTEGTDVGGLFIGSVAADTTYHCFVIRKDDGTVDCGFDININCSNIPGGYTSYRYIHSLLTDSSSNILGFFQSGDTINLKSPVNDLQTGSFNLLRNTLALSVADGLPVLADLSVAGVSVVDRAMLVSSLLVDDVAVTSANCTVHNSANSVHVNNSINVLTNSSGEIAYKVSDDTASGTLYITTNGWTVDRG